MAPFVQTLKTSFVTRPPASIASASPQKVIGTTGLCPPEVPWWKPRLVLCFQDKSQKGVNQPQVQPEKRLQTDRNRGQRSWQERVVFYTAPFHSGHSLTSDVTFLLQAAETLTTKSEKEMTKDLFPLTSNSLRKCNPLNKISTAEGIWKAASYWTATLLAVWQPLLHHQNQAGRSLSITITLRFI